MVDENGPNEEVESLRATLRSLEEQFKKREALCEQWKKKFMSKKTEMEKIAAKKKAAIKASVASSLSPEEEKKILAEKDEKIKQLKSKLMEFKDQIKGLRTKKDSKKAGGETKKTLPSAKKKKTAKSPMKDSKMATKINAAKVIKKVKDAAGFIAATKKKAAEKKKTEKKKSPQADEKKEEEGNDDGEGALAVGMKVSTTDGRRGVIRFIGKIHCAKGIWVGMELFSGQGSNSGIVKGKRYFECAKKKGIMVKMDKIVNPAQALKEKLDEDGIEEIDL